MTKQEILMMLMSGQSLEQIVMNFLGQNATSNPLINNMLTLAKGGDSTQLEQIARNLAAQRGIDFDKAFGEFQSFLGAAINRRGQNK